MKTIHAILALIFATLLVTAFSFAGEPEVEVKHHVKLKIVDGDDLIEVDEHGFDEIDRKILGTLIERYSGGPAGIQALAAAVGEDRGTLEDLYEPFLIQEGFLQRTPRGRVATHRAYDHLGFKQPPGASGLLF